MRKHSKRKKSSVNKSSTRTTNMGKYNSRIQQQSLYYEDFKQEIDILVQTLKNKISNCEPLGLMNFLTTNAYLALLNNSSEFNLNPVDNQVINAIEYVQSVLVSSKNNYAKVNSEQDPTFKYEEILADIEVLQSKIINFYSVWTARRLTQEENANIDELQYIIESQFSRSVSGDRYQYYQIDHLNALILPHNEIILELFQLTANEFIEGLKKLEYSLSSGKLDAFNALRDLFDDYREIIEFEGNFEEQINKIKESSSLHVEDMFGYSLYDVKAVTGWSDTLISSLSISLDENKTFFSGEFAGWPNKDLPVHKKPFIKIEGVVYCFDYYSLFDNIYRVMQKTIRELKESYVNKWSEIQQHASEVMVEDLMVKLLPGCQTYRDNYYPKASSLKDCAENDILVVYENTLFIIEVKAGSFVYTPAITDYKAHISSFKALIEKADYQCLRTLNYINAKPIAPIYDKDKNKKIDLKFSEYTDIFTVCVTVDNFNEFAAKAEKLSFIKLESDSISISIDDLRVYTDIFDSPLYFLHYFKERKKAVQTSQVSLNDELDHLGLYFKYNWYTLVAKELNSDTKFIGLGFREEIDNYFASLHNENLHFDKPRQPLPDRIQEIFDFMSLNNTPYRQTLADFLLNYDFEIRKEFADSIDYSLIRQREINRMNQISANGENGYTLFIHQPQIGSFNETQKDIYAYANLALRRETDQLCISLYYGIDDELIDIKFKKIQLSDLSSEKLKEIKDFGDQLFVERIKKFKEQNSYRKIGRNEPCLCGSGRKLKNCCIEKYKSLERN